MEAGRHLYLAVAIILLTSFASAYGTYSGTATPSDPFHDFELISSTNHTENIELYGVVYQGVGRAYYPHIIKDDEEFIMTYENRGRRGDTLYCIKTSVQYLVLD
jgi:hypothetical protein